ncbi:dynein heavy chain and region D6 of dynein motor-domain-containing protein [Zopfochytrium polystomum]|nr:dynein heavy chain and region D6 of dynein motor-domain-containing protein [Zopfochytrium polystomum]
MDGADANTTGPTRSSVVVEEDPPKVSDPGLSLENSPSTPQRVTDDAGEPLKVAPSSDTADVPAGEVAPEEQRDLAGPESLTTLPPNGGDLVDDSNSGEPTPDDDGVDNIEVREQQDATVDETAGEPLKVDDQDSLKSRRSVNEAADSSGDRGSMHGESVPRAHTLEGEDATTAGTAAENASASLSPPRSREAEPEHHETLIGQFETAPDNGAECDNLGSAVELPLPQSSMNGNEGIPAERLPSTGRKTVGTSARSSVPGGHNGEGTGSHQRQTPRSVKGSADRTGRMPWKTPSKLKSGGMRGVESARAAEDDALQHEENRLNSVNPEIPSSSQEAQTDLPSRSVPRASLAQEGDSSSEDIDIPPLRPSGGALSPARRSEEDNAEQVRTSAISPRKSPDLRTSEINGRLSAASPSKTQSADEAAAAITTELRASPQSRTSRHSRQEDFENRALKHSASSTSDQRQTSARALQSSAANSKTGTPEKDMTGASSGRDASVVSQSFQGEDKVPTMRSERPSILRHMDDFGTAISAKISKQPQVVKLTDSSTSPASTAHQSQVAVQAAELSSTALEPAKSSASTLRKERGSAGIKPAKPLLSTIADSPRVQSAVSEKNTAPSAAANAEHLMRIQSLLTQRLHTVSTGSALPHFNFDMSAAAAASRDELMNPRVGKHKNRLPAGVDPSTRRKATPPKLAPLVSHGIASLQNGLSNSPAPVILRAKKPVVVPASSRQTRSGGLRQDQQSTGQLDPAVLQSVIRPRGTHASPLAPPEEDLSRRIFYESPKWSKGAFSAMGNVVPPIPSSAESSSAVGQFPPTSLPVGKKGPSEDLPQNKPRTLSAKDRLAAVVASQLPQSRTAATGGRAAAVGSIRWMEQNASMPDAFLRVDAISTVPRMPKFKDPFDFIAYIQKQRHSDEFVYLRPIRAAGRALFETYNPYNLEIVEYEDLETGFGFYTLSRMVLFIGMTHVNANGRGDFTPLSQWIREHKLFNALLKIPFFARYKTWKAFSTWRRNVRRFKIRNAKAYLNKNAFILQPCLRQSLLSIVVHAQQVLNYRRFFFVNLSKTYELSEFVAEQQKRIEDIRTNVLRNWEASTRGDVEKAGLAAMSEKGFDVTLKEDMPRDENSGGHAVLDAAHKGGALPGALEGPAEKPPPVQLSFTEQAARRAECKRMQRFVKLVDYIIVHTLHMLAVESARDMLTAITRGCADEDVAMVEPEEDALEGRGGSRRLGWQAAAMKSCGDPATSGSASSLIVKAGPGGAVSLPVGGVVVGKEVGTQELVQCGYYGFASIITRIKRSQIQPVELHDPVVELEPGSGGADAELAAPPAAKLKSQKQSNTTEVIPATKKFVPMFRLQLLIDTASESRHLHFAPELVQFLEAIDTILKSYVSTLEETHLISGTIPFLDPAKLAGTAYSSLRGLDDIPFTEGPSASAIVVEGGYFREVCGRIRGTMVGLFSNATKWMQQWDGLRQMWIVNEKFTALEELFHDAGPTAVFLATLGNRMSDVGVGSLLTAHAELMEKEERDKAEKEGRPFDESLVAKKDVLELGSTVTALPDGGLLSPVVNFFGNQLARFADEKERMAEIPALYVLNNVSIDTIELKKVLAPSPERCFSEVSGLLPPLARDKNELLLNEVQTWIRVLNSQPQTVELFVEYLGWLEKVKQSMPLVQLLHEEVTKLYVIMANYKTPIQPTDFAMYQTLSPALRQLKEVLDMAGDTKDDNITRFSGELDKLMNDLMQEVSEIRNRVQEPMVLNPNSASDLVIQFIDELNTQLQRANATKLKYERWSDLFKNRGVAPTEAPSADQKPKEVSLLDEAKAEVELKRSLWISLRDWDLLESSWKSKPFETLNTEEMNSQIAVYLKTVYNLDKGLPPNDVVPKLKAKVEHFRSLYSTIVDLRNPALKPRHWERIQETIGKPLIRDEHFTLETLLDLQLFSFKEEIGQISSQAGSEAALEEMLTKVVRLWSETEFIVLPYRDSKDVFILGSVEDIQTQLEDSQVTIATIKSSRFIGPIKSEVERWDKQLSLFSETLEAWLICQRNWLYLESIFSAPDIQRQLPDEARMFSQVDRSWKDVMRKASRNPNAMKNGTTPGLLETMNQNNNLLEQIQKCLEDYLESKRLLFPRFYFLSNDELLEILSQTRNPQAVQPHLSKCFDAIKSLEFGGDAKSIDIFAMISPEGERVPFLKTVKARGNVEGWLGSVEEAMVSVLKRLIKTALVEYEGSARTDWLKEHVGQAVLAANQIIWSRDASEAIKSSDPAKALVQFRNKCISNLSGAASLVRGDLTKIQRAILGAVITIDVHNRDIVQSLVNSKVSGIGDFEWVKQQRYYWDVDSDSCTVRMASSSFLYGYEYLGCSPRLVITPLTDRCYLTLCGAMQLNLGGSPVGPAGTGKTETVKDLGKALARQCVVFNCSDGLDYKMMGKMFAGLAQSGAWCCFDEFNRIDIEVLSVIAQQLLTIKNAKDLKLTKFNFEGREIRLIDTCAAFITMNPGYAGRTELPDNLKALFRPIAMMIPGWSFSFIISNYLQLSPPADYGLIAEIMLFSEGFENAKVLAGKVVNLYKLCSEQLSQQDHYDFGMRAVKSVLIMAGSLKRASPDLSEDVVLIRSLRDSNLPKFLAEDVGLFRGILQDLFPGVTCSEKDFELLSNTVRAIMSEKSLEIVDAFISRVCQLYETMKIRHGVMLVGPTGGGKTTCYELLQDACGRIKEKHPSSPDFQKVKTWVLNPKCVAMTELYGEFNLATMEWKDGLIGVVFREQVADTSPDEKWTVCDGPVDALWIENMNTVLDDNKLLTLINGERIKMSSSMHMLFEVADLAVASPATVSRCGMVYMDPTSIGWWPFVKKWLRQLPDVVNSDLREVLTQLFGTFVEKGLQFIRRNCKEYINSVNLNLVASLCKLITTFINRPDLDYTLQFSDIKSLFSHIFVFCYVWSLGGNLADGYQDSFDSFVRESLDANPIPDVHLPSTGNVFSFFVDFKNRGFTSWDEMVPQFEYSSETPYFKMIVPTPETVKYSYLLEALLTNGFRTLFSGNTGVGKSVIVQDLLSKISRRDGFLPLFLNFSAQTSSAQTQQIMELKLEKKRKNISGAPTGFKKIVLFVDDLNMPKLDTYGSQPPIELLRQYVDFGGFYDREKLTWKVIQDIELVACCAPPGGGRNNVTPRFLRHFNILNIPAASDYSLGKIFKSIVEGFLKPFTTEIRQSTEAIVTSAIEVYHCMCTELLPTPAKSHYTFNLRDLSKVVQGILQVKPQHCTAREDIARLFCHEASRVFHDRLIDGVDRAYFNQLLSTIVDKNFGTKIPPNLLAEEPIMFGDFLKRGVPPSDREYVEIEDMKGLNHALEEYLEEYNVTMNKEVRLIFFLDARQHISRISRILRQPRGNALLVGVGGTGKQSLTRLACHISDYHCFQVELTRTYGDVEWREDLKKLYISAGLEGKQTVFLLSDTQIKKETFLEDINSVLNSGEVPNLFELDEREKILGQLRPILRERGEPEDRDTVFQFFISRVRDNLHIVLATSPVGDTFRNRCRMFPSLVNCSTIDWFDEWPEDALLSVSQRFLEFVDLGSDDMKSKIATMCVEIHMSVGAMAKRFYEELRRRYYTTPTSYLELINLYVSMLQEKRRELGASRDRLRNGLNKLLETNDLVANMQVELQQLGPELQQRAADTEALMVKISKDQETADGVRKVVAVEETAVREKAVATEAIAAEAQKDLDEALPALEAAYKALDALEKKDIAELKVFSKPPDLVLLVMEAICILFKVKPDWDSSKKLLSDPQFMKKMAEYDKDNIPEAIIKKLQKYVQNPGFNPETVEKVSRACKSMVMWVIAMDLYSRVFKEVAPKRRRLEEAQQTLEQTMAKLAEKTAALQDVENQLDKLKQKYESSIASKKILADKMEETTLRLARASKLTLALADEQVRWSESVNALNEQIEALIGNIFLCAASVAYYGAFTSVFRQELVVLWIRKCQDVGVPVSETFQLGLPADTLSTENGILVMRGRRWPLMIDPQGQANRWIRNLEGNNLKVIKLTESKFLRSLENAVRTGQAVLIEDVGETLDPALEPLLLKQITRQGGRLMMKLGDSLVEYDRNFRLYITTKLANPHYLPEICIKVTIINFTVTPQGLEGQLLADVVKLERPELEEQRNSLIVNIANDKKQLKDIEDKILKMLFNSQGNILDDEELIDTLNQSKVTSAAIKERVVQAEVTELEINSAREKYRPVAIRGYLLYFVVADLSEMDPMYQFSLKYFKNLFNLCIIESPRSDNLSVRIQTLCKNCTAAIFSNVSRGLFESHKLIYAFMIAIAIMRQRGDILDAEWNFFLRGGARLAKDLPSKPNFRWLSQNMWQNIYDLSTGIPQFNYLVDHISMYGSEWEDIINSDNPFLEPIPGNENHRLSDFHRLILVKVIWEEKLVAALIQFVKANLGQEFIDIPPLDLAKSYKDTEPSTPMIFILSVGSDPVSLLMKLASSKDLNMLDRLHMISLGQGQGPIAEELLRRAIASGDWVFLQNCHLAKSWMNRLETIIKEFSLPETKVHPSFRLFLSSMPSKIFPISVLQDGVKVTNEPPKGLRANVARSFADISQDLFEENAPQGVKFRKLLFGLCFFNAIIHERKKFGPLGWNILYDWSNADLEVSITILKNTLRDSPKSIPWDALLYLTGDITFGGRVTDDWDRRTLKSILAKYYTTSIFDDAYRFSPSGIYFAPPDGDLAAFRTYIDSLPFTEEPSIFGMHENANISFQLQEAKRIVKSILDVQPRLAGSGGGAGAGMSSEELVAAIASQVLENLPNLLVVDLDTDIIRPDTRGAIVHTTNHVLEMMFKKDESGRMLNSLSTVLMQEAARFNKLLTALKASLENLLKAVKGLVVMSFELELVFNSLLNNEVPAAWANIAYPSLKPLASWVKDLKLRVEFLYNWIDKGQPSCFWLPGLFFPQGFLTGVLQNHARKYNVPIDSLLFAYRATEYEDGDPAIDNDPSVTGVDSRLPALPAGDAAVGGTAPPPPPQTPSTGSDPSLQIYPDCDSVLIRGLFIEGARWNRKKRVLQDSYPMEMFSTMPLLRFIPTQTPQDDPKLYTCPLYKTSARAGTLSTTGHSTNFVIAVKLPTDRPPDYWIAKGVALLCQLTE